jgi:hypothetical protein
MLTRLVDAVIAATRTNDTPALEMIAANGGADDHLAASSRREKTQLRTPRGGAADPRLLRRHRVVQAPIFLAVGG